jgi:hypothetical protein
MTRILAILAILTPTLVGAEEQDTATAAGGGEPGWKISIQASAMTALNTYSDSWEGGEAGSINWTLNFDGSAEKQLSDRLHIANTAKLAFGETHTQDKETDRWLAPAKTTDQIDLESVFKLTFGWFVDPYVGARLESRFWDVPEDTLPSGSMEEDRYLNPLLLTESFGATRDFIDNDPTKLQMRLGGAARQDIERLTDTTIVANDAGLELITSFKTATREDWITFTSLLKVFTALASTKEDETRGTPREDEWRYPDVDWENTLTINITTYIMAGITHQLLYDKEVHYISEQGKDRGAKPRWKLTASIGVTFAHKR